MSIRVAILRGGRTQHTDSVQSGASLLRELSAPYIPQDIYIDTAGVWHRDGKPMSPQRALYHCDVVCNALHDTSIVVQQTLVTLGVPHTGSGPLASSSHRSPYARALFATHGVRMPRTYSIRIDQPLDEAIEAAIVWVQHEIGMPVCVHVRRAGSAEEPLLATTISDMSLIIADQLPNAESLIIEEYIVGVSACAGVVENFRGHAVYQLPAVQVTQQGYTYPGQLSESERGLLQEIAATAHGASNAQQYSESKLVLHPTRGVFLVAHTTTPALYQQSSFMHGLEIVGVTPAAFFVHILTRALGRN